VIAINTEGDNEREQRFLRWSLQGRVDGVVGVFFTLHAEDFKPLAEIGVAVVRIESSLRKASELPIDNISVDNRGAAAVATRFLLARGHERVAMIAGPGGPQGERAAGYLAALAERGLAPDIVSGGEFNEQGGRNGALALLARERRPTAIFAANDLMAIGAMSTLRDHGIVVPRDLAIVGFDDIFVAQLVTPSLTTVSQFQSDLGVAAAQALLARLSGATGPGGTSREMPFKLIERQST
jgi:LacI family transcriptional regulator